MSKGMDMRKRLTARQIGVEAARVIKQDPRYRDYFERYEKKDNLWDEVEKPIENQESNPIEE